MGSVKVVRPVAVESRPCTLCTMLFLLPMSVMLPIRSPSDEHDGAEIVC